MCQKWVRGRIRFAAAKPRPGKQSSGLFTWTGLTNLPVLSLWGRTDLICICSRREQIKESMRSSPRRATVHRPVAFSWVRIHIQAEKRHTERCVSFLVGEDGFEPSKRYAADLQSVPFGHSGTPPYVVLRLGGAGRRTRSIKERLADARRRCSLASYFSFRVFSVAYRLEPVDGLEPPTY